ncbi:hypothetical protein D3C83_86860 [compost metagenome]
MIAYPPELAKVFLKNRMLVHVHVHGWRNQHRRLRGHHYGGQEIVGDARRQLPDDIGGRRGNSEHIGFIG